jgi:hypothetical protein
MTSSVEGVGHNIILNTIFKQHIRDQRCGWIGLEISKVSPNSGPIGWTDHLGDTLKVSIQVASKVRS